MDRITELTRYKMKTRYGNASAIEKAGELKHPGFFDRVYNFKRYLYPLNTQLLMFYFTNVILRVFTISPAFNM